MAAQQPPDCQAQPAQRSVGRDRGQRVLTARRVEPATWWQSRTYPSTVRDDRRGNDFPDACGGQRHRAHSWLPPARRVARPFGPRAERPRLIEGLRLAARAASRSAARVSYDRSAAPGCARTTRCVPEGRVARRSRTRWRRRLRTLFRTTALPIARDTTNPALVDVSAWPTCTTTAPRPARRPERIAAANSLRRLRRCPAASTTTLRRRDGRVPWPDAKRGSRDRHGCACAAGSRGSSRAGGCSAGRCACSLCCLPCMPCGHAGSSPRRRGDEVTAQGYSERAAASKRAQLDGTIMRVAGRNGAD
jgi:hypothetical protein